ncbi:hypothetical protein, partial [uncultured Thiodictyon sp.]|uniref:hypothetical protein n=1 Tax=uncultured Thiodictyon sp. TaxID=1846217 RepID=UPI0025FFA387
MGTPLDTDVSATADQVKNRLFDCIDALTEALVADEPICARLQSVSDVLGALGKAADDEGLAGLIEAAALVADRISAVGDDEARQETVFVLLAQLPLLLMDYVLSPADLGAGDALVGFLQSDDWGVVMDDEEVDLLRMLLQPPPDMDDENSLSAPARQRVDAPMAPEVAALAAASPASAFIGCPAAQSEESAPTPPAATFMPPDTQVQAVTSDMLAPAVEAFEAVELAAAQEPPAAQHRPVAADALDVSAALPNDIDNLSLTPTANEEVDSLRTPLQPPPELEGESPLSAPEFALNEPPMEPDVTAASADSLATAFSAALDTESEEPAPTPSAPAFVLPTTAVQSVPNEMLALAVEAFEANYVGLLEALAIAAEHEPDRRRDGREQLRDELERLAAGAETIGLAVLAQLLSGIHAALGAWQPDPGPAQDGVLTLLATLPEYLRGYLSAPTDRPAAEALVRLIGDLDVGATLFGDHAELLSALTAVELAVAPLPEGQHRPLVADPLDLSLGLPEDINQELLEGLLTELPIQTAAFTEAVHRIASGRGGVADIEIA